MAGIFERGGLTEDLRYASALMRMMRGTNWTQCYQGSQPINLSHIPVACVASGSARVRRENWNSPFHFFFCTRFKFRAITRLETLATQANIPVNKRTNSRLWWTKYSDLYEIVHLSLVLISLCLFTGAVMRERSIAAIFWKNCSPVIKHNPCQLACLTSALWAKRGKRGI